MLAELISFIAFLLQWLIWLIIAQAIFSWLVAFNVVNTSNRFVYAALGTVDRLLDPLLRPIRSRLPEMGGIDLSPLLLILIIMLVQRLLNGLAMDMLI
jgi:YggT family protein